MSGSENESLQVRDSLNIVTNNKQVFSKKSRDRDVYKEEKSVICCPNQKKKRKCQRNIEKQKKTAQLGNARVKITKNGLYCMQFRFDKSHFLYFMWVYPYL